TWWSPGRSALRQRAAVCAYDLSFFFQAEDGIRDATVTGVQTCALPISSRRAGSLCCGGACSGPGSAPGTFRRRRPLGEDLLDSLDAGDQGVDIVQVVVDVERRPRRRGEVEP